MKNAATTNGDAYVSIIPFSKNVNVGASNYNASWIDWTDWEAEPTFTKPANWSSIGPGSSCPFTNSNHGFVCTTGPVNNAPPTTSIPSSGSFSGYICPDVDSGRKYPVKIGLYYNGCYNSVPTTTTSTNGRNRLECGLRRLQRTAPAPAAAAARYCKQNHDDDWRTLHAHLDRERAIAPWNGCVADRGGSTAPSRDYDRKSRRQVRAFRQTLFPAEQNSYCSPCDHRTELRLGRDEELVDNLYPPAPPISRSAWSGAGSRLSAAGRSRRRRRIPTTPTTMSSC